LRREVNKIKLFRNLLVAHTNLSEDTFLWDYEFGVELASLRQDSGDRFDHSIPSDFEIDEDNKLIFAFTTGSTVYPERLFLVYNPY
jgi:hypothetical protein